MEHRLHQGAIEGSASIKRRNHRARYDEWAESGRSGAGGIELIGSIDIGMNTVNGLTVAPRFESCVELSDRPSDDGFS
jgi:hypothetical protein